MKHAIFILSLLGCSAFLHAGDIETHRVESEYQDGKQEIRVLLPDDYQKTVSYSVLYVLPVEKEFEDIFGYGLGVLKELNAHNQHNLIIVQMGFEKEPWFGDHATDPKVRQGSYVKDFVVPFIEKKYSTLGTPEGRLLFGFSKSGWGAFSLILKYPEYFGYAAAWDAPITFTTLRYGMKAVYGTAEQLALYRPDLLIPKQKRFFEKRTRLVLTGSKLWWPHTDMTHKLLEKEGLKHHYDNSLRFPHRWDKAWVEPTLSALIALTQQDDNNGRRPSPAGEESRLVTNLEAGKKQHIVAYGTSLTAGGAWVKQLDEALNKRYLNRVKITNSGGGGCNSEWGVEKLQSRVIDLKPDAVFVEFAMNDSVERFHLPLKTAKANLETMIDRIHKDLPDCLIILQVMNPVINRPEGHRGHRPHLDDYYQMYRDVAAERKLALVDHAPSWKVVLDQGKDAFREFVPDGLHPNAEGCKRIVTPNILKALKVEKAEPKTSPDKK